MFAGDQMPKLLELIAQNYYASHYAQEVPEVLRENKRLVI